MILALRSALVFGQMKHYVQRAWALKIYPPKRPGPIPLRPVANTRVLPLAHWASHAWTRKTYLHNPEITMRRREVVGVVREFGTRPPNPHRPGCRKLRPSCHLIVYCT
jgi:hypothetical protein